MRRFALDALEHGHDAPAPELQALAAIDALKEADVLDRQGALFALIVRAAGATELTVALLRR